MDKRIYDKVVSRVKEKHNLVEETDSHISFINQRGDTVTYRSSAELSEEFIDKCIIPMHSTKKLPVTIDKERLAMWIHENIEPWIYMDIRAIVIMGKSSVDRNELASNKHGLAELLPRHQIPSSRRLGSLWKDDGVIMVNLPAILKGAEEMVKEGDIMEHEKTDFINWAILSTVAHEIRHLAHDNPYIMNKDYKRYSRNNEDDAEIFSRNLAYDFPITVARYKEKELKKSSASR